MYNFERTGETSVAPSFLFLFLLCPVLERECVGLEGDGGNKAKKQDRVIALVTGPRVPDEE